MTFFIHPKIHNLPKFYAIWINEFLWENKTQKSHKEMSRDPRGLNLYQSKSIPYILKSIVCTVCALRCIVSDCNFKRPTVSFISHSCSWPIWHTRPHLWLPGSPMILLELSQMAHTTPTHIWTSTYARPHSLTEHTDWDLAHDSVPGQKRNFWRSSWCRDQLHFHCLGSLQYSV